MLDADSTLHYSAETGKFYKLVSGSFEWTAAKAAAEGTALNTINGQLVTIRSAGENALVTDLASNAGGSVWLGGTDQTTEGDWRWIESGTETDQFWSGAVGGSAPAGAYENWFSATQPNDVGGVEDAVRLSSADGQWYDAATTGSNHNYLVEWDADAVLDATDALTYTIQTQTVTGAFAIDADSGEITVADGSLLDYETDALHSITVRVTDGDSNTYEKVFTVSLADVQEAPTDITPDSFAVNENIDTTSGHSLGTLTHNDPDTSDTFTYSIVGGVDAAKFTIGGVGGDELILTDGTLDYENQSSYSVTVRINDGTTSYDETLTVNVSNVNEAPVVLTPGSALSATEQVGLSIEGTGFSVSDVDSSTGIVTLTLAVGEGRLDIDIGNSGTTLVSGNQTDTVTITGPVYRISELLAGTTTGTITFTADSDTPSASTTITVTVNDQGNNGTDPGLTGNATSEEGAASQTINLIGVNDAPEFLGTELITNGTFDTDLAGWTTTGQVGHTIDRMTFGNGNFVGPHTASQTIATTAGETYKLTFDYRDSHATKNQSLQVSVDGSVNLLTTQQIVTDIDGMSYVRYEYTFTADSAATTLTFRDTSDTAGISDGTIAVDGHLDNISVKQTGGQISTVNFTEGGSATTLAPGVTVTDHELLASLDSFNLTTLTLSRNGTASAEDLFQASGNLAALTEGGNLVLSSVTIGTVTTNSLGSLVLTFNSAADFVSVNETLQSITYQNTSTAPSPSVQLDWSFDDGNGTSQGTGGSLDALASTTVNITSVNSAPVIASGGYSMPTITEDDIDNAGQTVQQIIDSAGGSGITDVDGDPDGIAVLINNENTGIWQYSIDGGSNWLDLGTVSGSSALLLGNTDLVRFQPNGNEGTPANFGFRAWDGTVGSAGDRVNIPGVGGTNAFSTLTETALIQVNDVADAPVVTGPATAFR